jgi:capsular polysaccharide export protein
MRRILFVGSPFGRFFRYMAPALEARGSTVWRTVSDGGELLATPAQNRVMFRGNSSASAWREFLDQAMRERRITAVVTFNDSCTRTRIAHDVAERLGIARYVIEEGYLRPWWITFDHVGVNGNSLLPKDPAFYLENYRNTPVQHKPFKQSFKFLVRDTIMHFAACTAMSPVLPYDPRYYGDSVWVQAKGYMREYLWRKTHSEGHVLRKLRAHHAQGKEPVFVALMQKPGDAQLRYHSSYGANNPYLRAIMASFATHADRKAILVIKQHPLDYGIEKSSALFNQLVAEYGLQGRAFYTRKLTIESVLAVSSGLVTINSTGGLAAVEQLVPTIALGKAIYDVPGLTFQDGIDRFWKEYRRPEPDLVDAFLSYLKVQTQINGGLYSRQSLELLAKNLTDTMLRGVPAPHFALARRPAPTAPELDLERPLGIAPSGGARLA